MNQKAALHYVSLGWKVLPLHWVINQYCSCNEPGCTSVGKHPLSILVPKGKTQASSDAKLIKEWWKKYPYANIGIVCGKVSGVFVLDIDEKHGGLDVLCTLEKEHGEFTPNNYPGRVITGGGGYHFYYKYPEKSEGKITSHTGVMPGIDIRADGTYVVAPPSNHVMGIYQWEV